MDIYMPGCSGIEALKVIRQDAQFDSMPVVFLSTESDRSQQQSAIRTGAEDFLQKPIADVDLIVTVTHELLSVAMLDIDHFKQVNDTHGHPQGGRVIKSLAQLLRKRLRKSDIMGRYGGEEFVIAMPIHRPHWQSISWTNCVTCLENCALKPHKANSFAPSAAG